MLNLLQAASDDQQALLGCALALISAGAILAISYYLSPNRPRTAQPQLRELPAPQRDLIHDRAA